MDYIYSNHAALALWQCTSLTNIGSFSVKGSDAGSHSALRAVFLRTEENVMGSVAPVKAPMKDPVKAPSKASEKTDNH